LKENYRCRQKIPTGVPLKILGKVLDRFENYRK
jgi:hypothetical protein